MTNEILIDGTLAIDPEFSTDQRTGRTECFFIISVDRTEGEKSFADFHRVILRDPTLVEMARTALKKKRWVLVVGSLENRSFDKPVGERRYVTEIIATKLKTV
jgi:single-stranded DNA-binding protein